MKRQIFAALVASILLSVPTRTWAAAGDPDPTFGNGGVIVQRPLGGSALVRLALQADGKLVAVGSSADSTGNSHLTVARYNTDGSLDGTFAHGGGVAILPQVGVAAQVIIQPDGKIVVGGMAFVPPYYTDFALARFNADGTLDETFGQVGFVTTSISYESDTLAALALQPDGKLVAAGSSSFTRGGRRPFSRSRITLVRYNADGTLDPSFGVSGTISKQISRKARGSDYAEAVAVQPEGQIVVGGFSCDDGDHCRRVFLRYRSNGRPDLHFGRHGIVSAFPASVGSPGDAMLLFRSDGKIVAAGSVFGGGDILCALVRFNADGSLDSSFGNGGIVQTPANGVCQTLASGPDGSLLAAGYFIVNNSGEFSGDFWLVRFTEGGSLDREFGQDGAVITDVTPGFDIAYTLVVQPDNNVVVGGAASNVWELARYVGGGT